MKVEFTKDEAEVLIEWAEAGMQADLDSYDINEAPYECSKKECKDIWISAIKKLKHIIKSG